MYKFIFADIGEGLHEGTVGEIYKNVGDAVKEGDSLFSVETDKVVSDIPSPVTGTITKVLMEVGEVIHVGNEIYYIDDNSGDDATPNVEEQPKEEEVESAGASVVGEVKVSNEVMDFSKMDETINTNEDVQIRTGKTGGKVKNYDGIITTPLARSLASEKGIDISTIKGTGFNGRVLVADIEASTGSKPAATPAAKPAAKPAATPAAKPVEKPAPKPVEKPAPKPAIEPAAKPAPVQVVASGNTESIKPTSIRKAIAKVMKNSWAQVAYTNLSIEVDASALWDLRKQMTSEEYVESIGQKMTFLPFIVKATAIALKEFPLLNAKYDDKTSEIIQFGDVNIGIAVDTEAGLMVPVVNSTDQKDIFEISTDIGTLAVKARKGNLKGSDMSGGTFSISNYGSTGAMFGVPVINYPELALLGLGAITDKVYANNDGTFRAGKSMFITVAADHRWIDGAYMGKFIKRIKSLLETPLMLGVF